LQQARVQGIGGDIHDLVDADIVGLQLLRNSLHLQHLQSFAPNGDVGHPRDPQQVLPDLPIGDHRHFDQGS
jgi:hypothetical protein